MEEGREGGAKAAGTVLEMLNAANEGAFNIGSFRIIIMAIINFSAIIIYLQSPIQGVPKARMSFLRYKSGERWERG